MRPLMKALILASLSVFATAGYAEDIAITGGTAFTEGGKGKVDNATVLISDGRIISVVSGASVPAGYRTVDAKGKWVTVGFMVADSTIGLGEIGGWGDNDDATASKAEDTINLDVAYSFNPANTIIANTRIEGVTRALTRFSGTKDNWRGTGAIVQLGTGDMIVKDPAIVGIDLDEDAAGSTGGSRSAMWAAFMAKLDAVKEKTVKTSKKKDDDEVKLSPSEEILSAVLAGKTPLMITVHRASDIQNVIRFKNEYGVQVIVDGGREAWMVAEELARADIPVVLDPVQNLPSRFDELASTGENAARLNAAGVKIAFTGPDSHNSRLVVQHAGNAVAMGLPWDAAVDALTVNPAQIYGIASTYGTLAPGMDADVVVWDGDPLEVMSSPDAVFIKGSDIPLVSRQTKLRDRYIDIPRSPALKH
ncbi:amidohydrolase family protein [Kordiimonas pumila]|uniref:Amidohydrolase family protein n=1 Tax=Kordiimonas pumila TaxID=2161677 RepID=A0ABV7D5N8_9PROT|nr:amidohydrolase family protein [Kordiimonas pumila]